MENSTDQESLFALGITMAKFIRDDFVPTPSLVGTQKGMVVIIGFTPDRLAGPRFDEH